MKVTSVDCCWQVSQSLSQSSFFENISHRCLSMITKPLDPNGQETSPPVATGQDYIDSLCGRSLKETLFGGFVIGGAMTDVKDKLVEMTLLNDDLFANVCKHYGTVAAGSRTPGNWRCHQEISRGSQGDRFGKSGFPLNTEYLYVCFLTQGAGIRCKPCGRYTPTENLVGAERFELPTLCSQSRCATRLRHAPTLDFPPHSS
jgi:hypothetical protein